MLKTIHSPNLVIKLYNKVKLLHNRKSLLDYYPLQHYYVNSQKLKTSISVVTSQSSVWLVR